MIAGPDSTLDTMIAAVADSIHALEAVVESDIDRSDADRTFFGERKQKLAPILAQLVATRRDLEDFDLGEGSKFQVYVEVGDEVLDRGVEVANARTKVALRGKTGLDSTHVFGQRVTSLTQERIALEPQAVLKAVTRLADVPEFDEKDPIAKDLTLRAQNQQRLLDERSVADGKRNELTGKKIKLVVDAAHALAALKGALDERFPRQRE